MIDRVEKYCTNLLSSPEIIRLPFHNLIHTQEVVQNVKNITTALNINDENRERLIIAAWFHDTGFTKTYKGHEDESKQIATKFLREEQLDEQPIQIIYNCIEATKMPQSPTTQLAEILCDADIFNISNLRFFYHKLLMRREWEVFCDMKVTDKEWHVLNLEFLQNFHFWSSYGINFLEAGKQENVERVKGIL